MTRLVALAGIVWVGLLACQGLAATEDTKVFDIPRLSEIRIDGDLADWGKAGFHTGILTPVKGRIPEKRDFNADVRLGWDNRGLLVALDVRDDSFLEAKLTSDLWMCDSLEVFLATKVGTEGWGHAMISPGVDPEHADVRILMTGHGTLAGKELPAVQVARRKSATGYTMEILMPWEDLAIAPTMGKQVGFQLWVTDTDAPGDRPFVSEFYPQDDTPKDSKQMHALRLAQKASPMPSLVRGYADFDDSRLRNIVTVIASDDLADKTVSLAAKGQTFATGKLQPDSDGRVMWREVFRVKQDGGQAQILLGDQPAGTVDLSDVARKKAEVLLHAGPSARPSVFYGMLPEVQFDNPLWAETLIGPYEIHTTYYDSDYNIVRRADKPGRYGAVVEVRAEDGRVFRRFLTLFAMAKPRRPWEPILTGGLHFVDDLGIRGEVLDAMAGAIDQSASAQLRSHANRTSEAAAMLAGLYEMKQTPTKDDFWSHPDLADRHWWLGLKRKMYGWDKQWPEPVVCPQPIEGKPATVVREGTPQEAGMKSDSAEKIDAVLTEWSKDSDQAFAVCVVRHGVIVLHKAYGTRDGKPMTVDTKSWMASITKLISGTCMMMLVDQGRIRLDDPAEKYLPALRGVKTNVPLTIRHLYTHTSGLDWHWGDEASDMEERIGVLLPHLEIGKRYFYNGTGMALACKALEAVSGQTLPAFYKTHLLDPLGCTNTVAAGASGDAMSVPLDMAKIGQMLLNKGVYGKMRFLREETFQQMLPRNLSYILGQETQHVYGIGMMAYSEEGLGKGTFAHGAASAATLRIDPENDLVIVMTRNAGGGNYPTYHPRFLRAIVDGIADGNGAPAGTGQTSR